METEELTWEQDYETNYPYVVGIYNSEDVCCEEFRFTTIEKAQTVFNKYTNKKYIPTHTVTKLTKYNAELDVNEEISTSEVK